MPYPNFDPLQILGISKLGSKYRYHSRRLSRQVSLILDYGKTISVQRHLNIIKMTGIFPDLVGEGLGIISPDLGEF